MKMEQCVPKRRHIKFRRPGNYPEENIQHMEQGESLKLENVDLIVKQFRLFAMTEHKLL